MLSWYSGDSNMIEPFRMEEDPDGTSQQVAVIMTGKVYREAGLKHSKHPEVEGMLYDKLCQIGKHKLRDDVRKMALSIALSVSDKEFKPTVAWLDNFMRRFCLSKKKMGFHSSAMLKQKGLPQPEVKPSAAVESITQEDVFTILGLTVDCDSSLNSSDKMEVLESDDLVNTSTIAQECVVAESSDGDNLLTNSGEEVNPPKTVVEGKVDKTSNEGVCEENAGDADESTINSVVAEAEKSEVIPELDYARNLNGDEPSKRVEKVPDTPQGQEISSAREIQKNNNDDEIEEVVLDDETTETQNSKGAESKIGKISIKKFEDLCEGVEKKKKNADSNGENSVEESASDSSDGSKDDSKSDSTRSAEIAEASDSEKRNVQTSKGAAIKHGKVKIPYSKAETKYYNKNIDTLQKKLEGSVMKCASCYEQVNHHISSLVFTHPVLGIFICKKCRKYYGKGNFCKDKEGYDEYCRLCAEGGDLLCCEQKDCFNGFCKRCVKRTMGRAELKRAETTESWACYVCDPMPLMELRALHRLILNNLRSSEKEDASLSRKDLKAKTLKNKFKSLKQIHQLKAQRETRQTSSNTTKVVEKNSKSDNKMEMERGITKSKGETEKEKTPKNCTKIDTNIVENCDKKPCPILRNALDQMQGMLSKCLENIKIIDFKWQKSKYSSLGTEKARHHVVKQLEAMRINFKILGNDLLQSSEKEITEESIGRECNEIEQSTKQKREHRLECNKQDVNAAAGKSDRIVLKEDKLIQQKCKSAEEEDTSNKDGKVAAEKRNNSKSNAYKPQLTEEMDMEVTPSDRFTDSMDHYEECNSSKACIPYDDEHSLPDLVDVIKGLISDHEEPMDMEAKMTMIKSLDIKNEDPGLLDDVKQKKKSEQHDSSRAADLKDEESSEDLQVLKREEFVETSSNERSCIGDKETNNAKICRNRRLRSTTDESRSGSDAEAGNKTVQMSSQQHKRLRLSGVSDDKAVGKKLNGKGEGKAKNKDVLDINEIEEVEMSRTDGGDNKNNNTEKSAIDTESDKQGKLTAENIDMSQKSEEKLRPDSSAQSSSHQHQKLKIKRDNDEASNEEDESLNKRERSLVESKEPLDSGEMEVKKDKHKETKKEEKEEKEVGGNDAPDEEVTEGNKLQRNREAGKEEECKESSEEETEIKKKLVQKKKKGDDNVDNSKKGKKESDQEKKTGMDRKSRRRQQRRLSENVDDGYLGLVEASETSEENTDEEIQRRRDDHTEKREKRKMGKKMITEKRGKKKKMEKKKLSGSETEEKEENNASTNVETKDIKAINSKDGTKEEYGNEENEDKEDLDGKEDIKRKNMVEECADFPCGTGNADVDKEDDLESEEDLELLPCSTIGRKEDKIATRKKEVHCKTENQKAKVAILESNSEGELEDKPKPRSKKKHYARHLDLGVEEDKESLACTTNDKTIKRRERDCESPLKREENKTMEKRKLRSNKRANQKAKAAILESENDSELEDKPKPRSKKKRYRKHLDQQIKGKPDKKLKVMLTEKEQEELRGKQLDGKCQVLVKSLSLKVQQQLDEDEFIYTADYPELDSDGCDADEEDSDKEFSRLMKFTSGKIKPGPKSKSSKLKVSDDKTGEVSNDDGLPGDGVDNAGDKASDASNGAEKTEDTEKNNLRKVRKNRKEGLLDIEIDKDAEEENEDEEADEVSKKKINGGISLNEKMKKHILMSSDEEIDEEEEDQGDNPTAEQDEEKKEREKYGKKKEEEAKKKTENVEDSDGEYAPKVHKKGYMNLNISTDDEKEEQKGDDAEEEEEEEEEEPESAYEEDSDFEESPRKRRAFQISSSDSDVGNKKTKRAATTEEESEQEEETPKSKRKRIRKMSSSSDGGGDEVRKESPSKHKKIRKVIRDEDLMETTKNATQEEEERRRRIAERQKNYNQIFMVDVESDQKEMDKLVLDFDPDTKSELVTVHEKLVKFLKPHQFKGIKFMWDATVESIEQLKTKQGGGCILAHCMGLGKTLQVITFCHTLLTNKTLSKEVQRIMVCCPVNTIFNWVAEFGNWLKGKMLPFDVIELASAKDLWGRAYRLDDWWREGGICIIGYNMFRNLSNNKNKRFKGKMKEIFQKTLLDPGPDVMVCDEGHMLKNEKTALAIAVNKVRTKRRIILTGTPLQNNLKEYHCMIQFVKPNLLGTKKEFMNRFVNPIEQGQCVEAMPRDVRRMKRRAHILHNLLEGCVQRFDYTVLKPFLPPKFEYVISVQLSEIQCKLYQYYLDNLARGGPKRQGSGLFVDFGALSRVWTHPKVLELAVRRAAYDEDEEDLDDFICDDTSSSDSSDDERSRRKKKSGKKKEEESDEEENEEIEGETERTGPIPGLTESGKVRVDWWKKVLEETAGENFEEEGYLDQLEHSGKIILLLDILRECCSIGDKVLLFSQSLLTLDMIEDFLYAVDQGELELPRAEDTLPLPYKNWKKERDYLRLDGSTSADTRKHLCNIFNNPSNERCRLFLISTRAGGLGINLVGANRVIIFDSSWNPSHDTQSIFRVYRFGQKKPCYIYRFVAQGTMEEKIYSRQVTKMSTALRVVDEHQIKRYFKMNELAQLYEFNPSDLDVRETPIVPKDRLLAELLQRQKDWIVTYHEHESLLENQTSEELTEEERKAAWEDYENEKKGFMVQNQRNSVMSVMGATTMVNHPGLLSLTLSSFSLEGVVSTIKSQNPNLSPMEICESVLLATKQIQKIHLNHYQRVQSMVYNLKNPMIAPEQRKLLPFGNHPEMLPMLEQQLRLLEDNIQKENQVITHIDQGTAQRNQLLSTANLMSAGLIRGQPASSGISSSTANYVERPSSSSAGLPPVAHSQEKKTASNDVILLD